MLKNVIALVFVAFIAMVGFVNAEDAGDSGFVDPVAPAIKMVSDGETVTIMNVGTAPRDVGGLVVITRQPNGAGAYDGQVLAKTKFVQVLAGNPYPEAADGVDEVQPGYFQFAVTLPLNVLSPLEPGTKLYLTNGVGVLATATVA